MNGPSCRYRESGPRPDAAHAFHNCTLGMKSQGCGTVATPGPCKEVLGHRSSASPPQARRQSAIIPGCLTCGPLHAPLVEAGTRPSVNVEHGTRRDVSAQTTSSGSMASGWCLRQSAPWRWNVYGSSDRWRSPRRGSPARRGRLRVNERARAPRAADSLSPIRNGAPSDRPRDHLLHIQPCLEG